MNGGALHVVHVKGGEGVLAGGVAVPVRQRAQLLQALGDGAREAVLPGHVRVQQHVLGRLALVAAVGAPQLLHLPWGSMHVRYTAEMARRQCKALTTSWKMHQHLVLNSILTLHQRRPNGSAKPSSCLEKKRQHVMLYGFLLERRGGGPSYRQTRPARQ